ncbi:hypothetical protein XA68_13426 [Ophiocordyceps unilateralis]|uniref:Uncharacterized protein n=1 Tax=Ophiocordyceps unilateralis TaxID=268505 RepID=A0A2A9PCL8_OPHUN|nr:hypothetical protein XA68_13426 [Ophiocordyceps unilateralis]
MADILGLRLESPFDRAGKPKLSRSGLSPEAVAAAEADDELLRCRFQASHVEAKLALHAIYVLRRMFMPEEARGPISWHHLISLRDARWTDGSRPALNIVISRANCARCGSFVQKLAAMTAVDLRIVVGTELGEISRRKYAINKYGEESLIGCRWEGGVDGNRMRLRNPTNLETESAPAQGQDSAAMSKEGIKSPNTQPTPPAKTPPPKPGQQGSHASVIKPLPATPELQPPKLLRS